MRSCVGEDRFGAAAHVLSAYLDSDRAVAVSDYTRELIISSAEAIDARHGTLSPTSAASGWPSPIRRSTPSEYPRIRRSEAGVLRGAG